MPSAFGNSGVGVGVLWLAVVGASTVFSLRFLAFTVEVTGERSYERMAVVLRGPWGLYLVAVLLRYRPLEEWEILLSYIGDFVKLCASHGACTAMPRGVRWIERCAWTPGRCPRERKKDLKV